MKFEDWAADPSLAMSDVGAECIQTCAMRECGDKQNEVADQHVASDEAAIKAAAAAAATEAADAEAKASIAYIKGSPMVRKAWISWLEEQTQSLSDTDANAAAAASSAGKARGAVGLAAIGFDPALHSQDTRAAFCAEHQRELPVTAASAAPTTSFDTEPKHNQAAVVPVVAEGINHLVLICVHAHNRFTGVAAMERIRGHYGFPPTVLVSLPCCHQFNPTNDLGELTTESYKPSKTVLTTCTFTARSMYCRASCG